MSVPLVIPQLVQRFRDNLSDYRSGKYNETQVRREFLDPFFEALGWDVNNTQGYAEAYKDVVHEDAVKVSGVTKAPDYGFRIGGTRKFFTEAKKPSVNLKDDISPAFQLRRYAWSAKLPLSILTDFEEFAVYDCRVKPDKRDKAATARVMYVTFDQYADRWEEIANVFSREAVLKGSFDRYAEATTGKRGTQEVDDVFLAEIERWRELLARNIALRNPGLSVRELNYAVQLTIDRLVFLRIGEDRGFEPYERLRQIASGKEVYARLLEVFREADARYNSGLFHFQAEKGRENVDTLTPRLVIDDKTFKDILGHLYYPDSPYDFNVMPADILGQVYEQFLGKVIRLTKGGRAEVEDKPEVKKAGGVYYTPTYIVDYIVKHTVGKLVEGKTPEEVSSLKICDPACGSGSFLLGAYQFLLDWHLEWYTNNKPERWARGKEPKLIEAQERRSFSSIETTDTPKGTPFLKSWKLTTSEKRRILLNNLYGVDIDPQAVEVTKLSLLLKVLEGENEGLRQLAMFHERVLPDLNNNIKCGNSLIGPDFYEGGQLAMFDLEESYRINAFDWEAEFPQVFRLRNGVRPADREDRLRNGVAGRTAAPSDVTQSNAVPGGFDAVIGNPPYIHSREGLLVEKDKRYFEQKYETAQYQINTYGLFLEKGVDLLKPEGLMGMIIPNYWLSTRFDSQLRQLLFIQNNVQELVNVYRVFSNATVDTLILIVEQPSKNEFPKYCEVKGIDRELKTIGERLSAVQSNQWVFHQSYKIEAETSDVSISFSRSLQLRGTDTLEKYFKFGFGMKPYQIGKGNPPQTADVKDSKIFDAKEKIDENYRPLLRARNVKRYGLIWQGDWLKYGPHLAEPRKPDLFLGPRILIQRIVSGSHLEGTYTDQAYICNTDVITLQPLEKNRQSQPHIFFFTGILLSKVCTTFLKSQNVNLDREAFPKINTKTMQDFPVPAINFSDPADVARHDRMVALVQAMLDLHQRLAAAHTPTEKTMLQRQITSTDRAIDKLVYELYGLTEEEVEIVES